VDINDRREENRANWNDRAAVHFGSETYSVTEYINDPSRLSSVVAFDAALFGDIAGLQVAHLQCHIGTDTISLARLGASVVGVDFAEAAIASAIGLAETTGDDARFVVATVYDAAEAVGHTVDFVYTSVGTICWLDDIDRWAGAVGALLESGGSFYIRDTHPMAFVFDEVNGQIMPVYDYFTAADTPLTFDEAITYTDGDTSSITHTRTHEWNHSLADIANALVAAGMRIDRMAEHQGIDWPFVPSAIKEGDQWFLPEPMRQKLPLTFSLWATKQ
jgi:SAM-dependent methyltransferase